MKGADLIDAIERFFVDLIGVVVPGAIFLLGILWVWGGNMEFPRSLQFVQKPEVFWPFWLTFSYVFGHGLTSIGEQLFKKTFGKRVIAEVSQCPAVMRFRELVGAKIPKLSTASQSEFDIHDARDMALSIAPEQRNTVYRFMFISLLNLGVATSFLLIAVLLILGNSMQSFSPITGLAPPSPWFAIVLVILAIPFVERRNYFYGIAMRIPFSMAVAELQKTPSVPSEQHGRTERDCHFKVYLAGGLHSGWQDKVKLAVPDCIYLDPRSHGLKVTADYTAWDLAAIRESDCVFACLESANPGGYALALEIGFARAIGKSIILVDEKSASDANVSRYLEMLSAVADVSFKSLQEGVDFLRNYGRLK